MQGVESNMRHHRRYQPLMWGAQRQKDHFLHYPHGGRTDSRFSTPNAIDDLEYDPTGKWVTKPFVQNLAMFGQKYKWGSFYPDMHYSHMLNYDYWKLDLPYVRPLSASLIYGVPVLLFAQCGVSQVLFFCHMLSSVSSSRSVVIWCSERTHCSFNKSVSCVSRNRNGFG